MADNMNVWLKLSRFKILLRSCTAAALLFLSGCVMPRHTVGLDSVLTEALGSNQKGPVNYRCTMGAHRGDSAFYTENTLRAIHSALNNPKYAFVEFDVQYSADNRVVVLHDTNLLRVFGRMDKVGESTLEELTQLTDGEVATYEDVMDLAGRRPVNIEIKSQGDAEEDRRLADFIMLDVKARKIENRVLISSISEEVVTYVNEHYPDIATGQVLWIKASTYLPFDFLTKGLYKEISESHADYLLLHFANLHNIDDLLRLKPKDKTIVFWSFDDTMYIVHKDLSDRMWGDSALRTIFNWFCYQTARPFR